MKADHPKLKTPTRSHLCSCAFFRHCTQTVLSPTTATPPPLPPPAAQPPSSSSSSSSSNTSQSFTQWRFPLSTSPISHNSKPGSAPVVPDPKPDSDAPPPPPLPVETGTGMSMEEMFHVAELHFGSGTESGRVAAVQLMEKSLVPNPRTAAAEPCLCPGAVVGGVVACLREGVARKAASKVLLALCLVDGNRRVAVESGAVTAVVEAMADAEGAVAERSLAALELLCTAADGAAEVRLHALAVPMMVQVMGRMEGRGKEHAISVLAVIYGGLEDGTAVAPPEEVARAVMLALQGDCSARGRRKGAQLLKILQENGGQM